MTTRIRPILFNQEMVIAILDGRKTQTRRIAQPPRWAIPDTLEISDGEIFACARTSGCFAEVKCPYGEPGDRLWVREAWCQAWDDEKCCWHDPPRALYRADGQEVRHVDKGIDSSPWRPSIHMPRWASRITLEVTSALFQSLQEITESDAVSEGMTFYKDWWIGAIHPVKGTRKVFSTARNAFQSLWCEINGDESWNENPWVWVVEFKVMEITSPWKGIQQ